MVGATKSTGRYPWRLLKRAKPNAHRDGHTVLNVFTELGDEWQVLPSDGHFFREMPSPHFPDKCFLPEDLRGERRRRKYNQ
mmetsp:Transcript_14950/g.36421  ORF Transcript_14950/g.36421 Transcript_14950/m.36421 type:complete len:81 (+) Transcript_14950:129-371(+)